MYILYKLLLLQSMYIPMCTTVLCCFMYTFICVYYVCLLFFLCLHYVCVHSSLMGSYQHCHVRPVVGAILAQEVIDEMGSGFYFTQFFMTGDSEI